jgi:hypothetical protein
VLPPDARSVLIDALRPPPGAVLERAVALTFTLDLGSALVAPLAFAGNALSTSVDPLSVMEAVRTCADRVDVFCQAGQISVPERASNLLAFLEPMIHPVRRPRPGRLFHPKLWALRYTGTDDLAHARLLVLSRNLADDRSWDVCLRLDGVVGTRRNAVNSPVVDLVRRARDLTVDSLPPERDQGIDRLLDDLRRVRWELPEDVTELRFHALGVPGRRPPDMSGSRHLVVSPFVNPAGLNVVAPGGGGTIVGRQEELDRLPDSVLAGRDVHVVSELAGLDATDDGAGRGILTGLHAKLYVIENGRSARVLLGSANATDAAFGGNVELLVELFGSRSRLGIDTMTGEGARFRAILEPYVRQPPVEPDPTQDKLEDIVRSIAAVPLRCTVTGDAGSWSVHVTSTAALPNVPIGVRVTAELLSRRGEAVELLPGGPVDAPFAGLEIVHITPFVVLTATEGSGKYASTVVHAPLVGDPPGRLDEILARQIDSPEKFLRFLELLLGIAGGGGVEQQQIGEGASWSAGARAGVLELLVTTLAHNPAQLDDLGRLVQRLQATERGRAVLPAGFAELWATIEAVRGAA